MKLFEKLPNILYSFGKNDPILMKDISQNYGLINGILDKVLLLDEFDLIDGETPEVVSEKMYGTPDYYWIVMLMNDRYHYIYDWLMPAEVLDSYINAKYPNPNLISHYVNSKGMIIDQSMEGSKPVTFRDHEINLNEKRRRIKLVSSEIMNQIVVQFGALNE